MGPMTYPLYGFTRDHVIPKGIIKLVVTMGEHPRMTTVLIEFLVVECPLTFNSVIDRPLLRTLKAEVSIHYLIMKFPIAAGIEQV